MSRQEHDREDLLHEATAYSQRVELRIGETSGPFFGPSLGPCDELVVFIGFRDNGCASFYFGAEPVYHFNSNGELRRGHHQDRLIKAEQGALSTLSRRRTANEVQLVRHVFDDQETAAFLAEMTAALDDLARVLDSGGYHLTGEIPPGANVARRALQWLQSFKPPCPIAGSPNAV